MMWDAYKTKYYDIGEVEPFIRMTDKRLANILRAIITCDGEIHSSFSLEKELNGPIFRYNNRNCAVVIRVKLPIGSEQIFEEISQCKLSEPIKVHLPKNFIF